MRNLFERGDIKYVILDLIAEQPRHGYEIIRVLEDRLGGLYSPSPGSVYPTLELLADMGCVESREQDGRKVFTITATGRRFLEEHRDQVAGVRGRMREWTAPPVRREFAEMRQDLKILFQLLRRGGNEADPDKLRRVRESVARARAEIEAILAPLP